MSSLKGTTWLFKPSSGGQITWSFDKSGNVWSQGLNMGTWVEDQNGNFMIQVNYLRQKHVYLTTWAGKHNNGQGNGTISPFINGTFYTFTMTNQSYDESSTVENVLFSQSPDNK